MTLLENGDFEQDGLHWYDPDNFITDTLPVAAHSGMYAMWLRSSNQFGAEVDRDITIPLDSPADLADLLGLSVRSLAYLRKRHGMPGPSIASRGALPSWYDRAQLRAWLAEHPQYRTGRTELL